MGEITPHPAGAGGASLRGPECLSDHHDVSAFDCGHADLNNWLARHAKSNDGKSARTYVVAVGQRVVAYYCLAAGSVIRGSMPRARLRRNMPEHVPVVVIGRLAVDTRFQGRGFGKGLLKDAIQRALTASELVGVRAIIVHAIDESAADFYRKFGFLSSPTNDLTFVLPVEAARQAL